MERVVVVGIGQMGGVFAHGLLRLGRVIVPVTRTTDAAAVAAETPSPELVLVAVGEGALPAVLDGLPASWRDRIALLQNELLPVDWQARGLSDPTVAVVWFEKKSGTGIKPILPTPVAGPHAELVVAALSALSIPAHVIGRDRLLDALVLKNLYILTANVAGLVGADTVGGLLDSSELLDAVAGDVLALEAARAGGVVLDGARLREELRAAFAADPAHGSRGRSAPARLARALDRADALGVSVPKLREIAAVRSASR